MKKTHNNNELTLEHVGKNVILQGFVHKIRKIGKKTFLDLRDMYGITQIVFNEDMLELVENIKNEFVIEIFGKVIERINKNSEISTGNIEVIASSINIINKAKLTPFEINNENISVTENTRLKYRYLDIRRKYVLNNLLLKSKLYQVIRNYYNDNNFIEIQTPILGKTSPEGARDFLVPSRLNKGSWYALPQSPQLYKQLLMVSGVEKYYQIARCFRDEDLRNDRQLEFDQLDFEMAFAKKEDVIDCVSNLVIDIFKKIKNINIKEIPHITWKDSIEKYGVDKPDIRFDLQIKTLNDLFKKTEFAPFADKNKTIRAIGIEHLLTKKDIELYNELANQFNANFFSFIKFENNEWIGPLANKLNNDEKNKLLSKFKFTTKGSIIFVVDKYLIASSSLGSIRNKIGADFNLYDKRTYAPCFIIDFPLFEWSDEENRFVSAHNPFTMPTRSFINNFENKKEDAVAASYDLVINGYEIGSGGERITDEKIQNRMFKALYFDQKQIDDNFGWFIKAYEYGAPYHSGMALGLERLTMILCGADSIRDVIAFPKNSLGVDLMNDAPSEIDKNQLKELI